MSGTSTSLKSIAFEKCKPPGNRESLHCVSNVMNVVGGDAVDLTSLLSCVFVLRALRVTWPGFRGWAHSGATWRQRYDLRSDLFCRSQWDLGTTQRGHRVSRCTLWRFFLHWFKIKTEIPWIKKHSRVFIRPSKFMLCLYDLPEIIEIPTCPLKQRLHAKIMVCRTKKIYILLLAS